MVIKIFKEDVFFNVIAVVSPYLSWLIDYLPILSIFAPTFEFSKFDCDFQTNFDYSIKTMKY